ncbi:MAG: DNA alkylation repair protein [Acidimicrobiia bacterium]|nr:DNA alkylation repair protein [Acidimicrobiia bacterium]
MDALVEYAQEALSSRADAAKAAQMAAYMKTDMPFYGVQTPARRQIAREMKRRFVPRSAGEYCTMVETLWALPHREEKYLAIGLAGAHPGFVTFEQIGLYRRLIVEGAWWDFVDTVASGLVGRVLRNEREVTRPVLDEWIDGEDMWLRRTAIISQLEHKDATDAEMLFDYCSRRAFEKEFFIRKAIGWALRQYARTDPTAVTAFLLEHRDELSGLSFREASKHLDLSSMQ